MTLMHGNGYKFTNEHDEPFWAAIYQSYFLWHRLPSNQKMAIKVQHQLTANNRFDHRGQRKGEPSGKDWPTCQTRLTVADADARREIRGRIQTSSLSTGTLGQPKRIGSSEQAICAGTQLLER